MTTKTREYLRTRRDEIIAETRSHQDAIKALQDEMKEVQAALNAIEGPPRAPGRAAPTPKAQLSVNGMVKSILRGTPQGLPTREIREQVKKLYGREITPKNMSWHMSNLRRNEQVVQQGERWKLKPQKNETPSDGESEGASSSTDEGDASSDESGGIDDLLR